MKTFRILAALVFLGYSATGQAWEFGSNFFLTQPVGDMTKTMNNAFGMNFNFARTFKAPFSLGTELNFGSYGSQTTPQQYTFDDGTVTETDVIVSNNTTNWNLTGKYFLRNNKKFNPYISAKLGWTWFTTRLIIEDPDDTESCHPLESDILSRDNTYVASGGAGVLIDFNSFFKKVRAQHIYFDLSVHASQGGTIRYMNVKHDPTQQPPPEDVMGKFLNTQTMVIHEHHVGYVYTSLLNMVEYRLGVICIPDWSRPAESAR